MTGRPGRPVRAGKELVDTQRQQVGHETLRQRTFVPSSDPDPRDTGVLPYRRTRGDRGIGVSDDVTRLHTVTLI